jgi:Abnormal spindle-like microcephaly-assoc'd, ASPM-SPD-2-Hydin
MKIPRTSFYVRVLAFVATGCFAAGLGASPAPQAAGAGAPQSAPATAATVSPRVHRSKTFTLRRAAVTPKPEQPGEPVLMPPTWFLDASEIPKEIVGQTSTPFPLIVTNSSTTATVHVTSVTGDNAEFVLGGDCTAAGGIAPGGTCTLQITYNPASACEDAVVDITFADDDPGGDLVLTLLSTGASAGGIVTDDLRDAKLSATQLAQSLVGPGVTISNVTYTGSLWSAGTFSGGNDILGFGTGIILSNGAVSNVIGPNCSTGITQSNATPGDTDLSNLIGQVTNDAAVLEFDFVPTSPTISFQYVFASDEYQDFVFDFNDVFAFFLGPEGSSKDIALIPGTNTIVSINNVNNGSTDPANLTIPPVNPQFYANNDFQFPTVAPFNTEMDGMTVVLTATAQVTPGQKNHIKLAVADAIDTVLDSNVFIKAGSLTSSVVSFAPSSLAFGNVAAGSTAAAQTVTLTNLGTVPLGSLAISTSSAEFAETNTCGTSLAAGASCAVSVTFTPQTGGLVQGNLSISDNAPDSPQVLSISGTGISGPFVSFSPFSLTFGPQAPGTTSPAQTITLTNTGTSGLTIGSITAAGSDFAAGNNCPENAIPPKGTCTITVTWTPSEDVTTETGMITITDNAQNQGTQTIGLTAGVTATVGIAPSTLGFGNQAVNTSSAAQTITLTNTGTAILTVPSVVVSSNFAETNTCTANPVAPGGTCTISVTFTPTAAISYSGIVSITDTATNSPQTVTLSGTGTAAGAVTIAPTALTFAAQAIGTTSAPQTVTITNGGTASTSLAGFSLSANFAVATGGGTCGNNTTLAPAASCTFAITFSPTATGPLSGSFVVSQNVTGGGPLTVALSGTGTAGAGAISLTPSSLAFGSQSVGTTSAAQTVTVSNTGTTTVTFTSFGVTTGFALGSGMNAGSCNPESNTIPAGGSCTINVQFAPTAASAITGTLTIVDNAAGGQQTVALSGTGVNSSVIISVPSGGSTTATTTPGGTAFFGLLITGAPGVTGTVQLTCGSSSPLITCAVIPSTVVLNGGTTEVAFGIQTFCQGSTAATGSVPGGFGGGIGILLAALMFGGIGWTFKRDRRVGLTFAMLMLIMVSAACGGLPKSANGATPAGTYFISLSTTLNGQTQTLQNFLTLVVK